MNQYLKKLTKTEIQLYRKFNNRFRRYNFPKEYRLNLMKIYIKNNGKFIDPILAKLYNKH